jgi:hypothetical protein
MTAHPREYDHCRRHAAARTHEDDAEDGDGKAEPDDDEPAVIREPDE